MLKIDRRLFAQFDWALLGLSLFIPLLGLVVLYSAGFDPDIEDQGISWLPFEFASPTCAKQGMFLLIGFVAMFVGLSIPTHFWLRYSPVIYGIGLLLLIVVAVLGTVVNGSRRWLALGSFNLQPAEAMKLAVIVALGRYLSRYPPRTVGGYQFLELLVPVSIIAVPMAFIIRQPDLGTALSLGLVGVTMILFMGVRIKALVGILLAGAVLAYPIWESLHDYQQRRVLVLLNPEVDPHGSGYHINQSKIAVGSGAVFGKGYLQGTQSQLEFLPEHTTDFVFSVLAEEWGFVGSVSVLTLYMLLLAVMLRIAFRSKDLFSCLLVFGITAQIFLHVLINTGMVIGMLPVVGIPLPLFSYGGSALISLMFSLGIVQGVSMRRLLFTQGS